ncbi:MAG: magnesium-translocating P-type ATPase [Methylocystis sp.]|uniref:magnesium-translocating P-type ATPase n=1 Tax=Methylocystis sp. TaxID=1911079 RepID=UPI003D0DC718
MGNVDDQPPYWSQQASTLMEALGSGPTGLSSERAAELLEDVGANAIKDATSLSMLQLLLRQFESPLVLILVFAAMISLIIREWLDATIVLAIVLGSSLLGFFQEYRASQAIQELKRRLELTVRVIRDGVECAVPFDSIVPGDVILLSAGNLIPADGLVLEAVDFLVSEASMTGESFPVEKRPGVAPADAPLAARSNAVFLGASVRSGTAKALAVRTGRQTEFGAIAARLIERQPETDFERGVRQFGYLLIRVMIIIVLFVLTVNIALRRPPLESLSFAVALAVGLSPELLPAIIAVTLSAGARAMSKRGVIVRRLDAIENLGSMDIFCTDKTGTLTEGVIVLRETLDPKGAGSDEVRRLGYLNAAFETGIENPLDAAIVAAAQNDGLTAENFSKVDEIPYDFMRRRLTVVAFDRAKPSEHLIITKGAFANVLDICTRLDIGGSERPLGAAARAALEEIFKDKSAKGFRVLAVATRRVRARAAYGRDDETEMTFKGFLVFHDPPKADAQATIRDLAALGVRIKIVTGDNRYVAAHLARSIGLNPSSMMTGEQLASLTDEALWNLAPTIDLFVEIDPQQKELIVWALQHAGHSVGYLGDGVNDAPALHAADVGISVEGAVDVARESADIILLDRDLDVLRVGVIDGRRTFANTLKYISITTSANFGNMISMALATPFLPFLPLAAKQVLLNNFLSDLPSITISTDNVDADRVTRPQRWSIANIRRFMIVFGLLSSIFDIVTFVVLLQYFHARESVFQTSWFVTSLLTELVVVLALRTQKFSLHSRPSALLLWSTIVVSVLAVSAPFLGEVSDAFGFTPLPASLLGAIGAIVVGYIVATEAAKAWFFRRPS